MRREGDETHALCRGLCSDPGELNNAAFGLFPIVGVCGELLLLSCLISNGCEGIDGVVVVEDEDGGGFDRRCSVSRDRNWAGLSSGSRVWTI